MTSPGQISQYLAEVPEAIKPYVKAMLGASGISEFDAVICVLFAISTHIDLDEYPILVFQGARGTGKSEAMKQLFPMCKGAKEIHGMTVAAHRTALEGVRTAFVDEGDKVEGEITDLYTKRFSKKDGIIEVNEPAKRGWELKPHNVFGATVMVKRTPIADVALRSRSIIVRTSYRLGNYQLVRVGDTSGLAAKLADRVRQGLKAVGNVDRIWQTWSPLYVIAGEFGLKNWQKEAMNVQVKEAENLQGGQGYEPSEAILQAINILAIDEVSGKRVDSSIVISKIREVLKAEYALDLKPNQIKEEATARGFEAGILKGYPVIKVKKDLLDKLLPAEG